MMIHEFAKLTGIEPAPECWERIEYVYMNCDEFKTKQDIAEFYKKHDMNGIEKKYQELMKKAEEEAAGGHHFVLGIDTKYHEFEFASTSIFEILEALDDAATTFGFELDRVDAMKKLVAMEEGKTLSTQNNRYSIRRKAGEV